MVTPKDWLNLYLGQQVVVDLDTGHILIGELIEIHPDCLLFCDADLHDSKKANSSKEVYLFEAEQHGINANRKRVGIPRHRVLAISELKDAVVR